MHVNVNVVMGQKMQDVRTPQALSQIQNAT